MSTTPLSVGVALDKLRSADTPKPRLAKLDEDIETLRRETQRMQAARRKLERGEAADLDSGADKA